MKVHQKTSHHAKIENCYHAINFVFYRDISRLGNFTVYHVRQSCYFLQP